MTVAAMLTYRTGGLPERGWGAPGSSKAAFAAPSGRPEKSAERTAAVASDAARRTWGPSIASPSSRPSAASIADRRASMSCRGSAYAQAAGMARRDQERSVSTISKLQGH